jgi:hypothetical protein
MVRGPIEAGSHLASLLVQRTRFLSLRPLEQATGWQNPNRRESAFDLHQSGSSYPARFAGHYCGSVSQKCRRQYSMSTTFPFLSRA